MEANNTNCWETPVKPWEKERITKIELKIVLEQYQREPGLVQDFGNITYWEKMGFEKKPSFYKHATREATTAILRTEPYKWFRHAIEFYPVNARFEYENCKAQKSTLVLSDLCVDSSKSEEEQNKIEQMETPKVNTVQDPPRVFMTITMGLIPTRERVEELERKFMSDIDREQKYFHVQVRSRLPSHTEIKSIKEEEEVDDKIIEIRQATEAKLLLQQFVYQINQINRTEIEYSAQLRKWMKLTNDLLSRFAKIDPTVKITKIGDWDEELLKPTTTLTRFQKRIARANYDVASMLFYDNK
jgi:hypothetical protein